MHVRSCQHFCQHMYLKFFLEPELASSTVSARKFFLSIIAIKCSAPSTYAPSLYELDLLGMFCNKFKGLCRPLMVLKYICSDSKATFIGSSYTSEKSAVSRGQELVFKSFALW